MPGKTEEGKPLGMDRREFLTLVSTGTLGGTLLSTIDDLGAPSASSLPTASSSTHGMKYRRLGRTEMMVSEIAMGCSPQGQKTPEGEYFQKLTRIIQMAIDRGVNLIDTAPTYFSEKMVGAAIKGRREKVYIATKAESLDRDELIRGVEQSLRDLGTDYIDLLHEHAHYETPEEIFTKPGFLEACEKLKRDGKLRFSGISGHSVSIHIEAIKTGYFDTCMIPYNYLIREPGEVLFPLAKKLDVGVLVIKPMTGNFKPWEQMSGDRRLDDLKIEFNQANYARASIKWALSNQHVAGLVIGMEFERDVIEDTAMAGERFTEDDEGLLAFYASAVSSDYCTMCNKCLPCPEGVAIPNVLRFMTYHDNYGHRERARRLYEQLPVLSNADQCTDCGECEPRCPVKIPIVRKLRTAHATLA